jgi:hypothetical protein
MPEDKFIERDLILRDAQRLYKLIGQNDFIDLILPNEIDKIVIKRKFNNNETFESIGQIVGLSKLQTLRVYEKAIRKINQQIRRFINTYTDIKTSKIKNSRLQTIKTEIQKIKDPYPSTTKKSESQNLLITDLIEKKVKWVTILNSEGIYTLGDLTQHSRNEILQMPTMWSNSVMEIEFLLNRFNMRLNSNNYNDSNPNKQELVMKY